ncbi:MAG: hypothetical protein ABW167_17080 [Baekduia sp.]
MARREAPGEVAGRRGRALTRRADDEPSIAQVVELGARSARSADDEPSIAQVVERVLERAEVLGEQQIDRPTVAAGSADPALEDLRAGALRGLLGQREQDRQLRLVVELAAEDAERVGVEDRQQLVVGEAEPVLQQGGGGGGQQILRTAGSRRRRLPTPSRR